MIAKDSAAAHGLIAAPNDAKRYCKFAMPGDSSRKFPLAGIGQSSRNYSLHFRRAGESLYIDTVIGLACIDAMSFVGTSPCVFILQTGVLA